MGWQSRAFLLEGNQLWENPNVGGPNSLPTRTDVEEATANISDVREKITTWRRYGFVNQRNFKASSGNFNRVLFKTYCEKESGCEPYSSGSLFGQFKNINITLAETGRAKPTIEITNLSARDWGWWPGTRAMTLKKSTPVSFRVRADDTGSGVERVSVQFVRESDEKIEDKTSSRLGICGFADFELDDNVDTGPIKYRAGTRSRPCNSSLEEAFVFRDILKRFNNGRNSESGIYKAVVCAYDFSGESSCVNAFRMNAQSNVCGVAPVDSKVQIVGVDRLKNSKIRFRGIVTRPGVGVPDVVPCVRLTRLSSSGKRLGGAEKPKVVVKEGGFWSVTTRSSNIRLYASLNKNGLSSVDDAKVKTRASVSLRGTKKLQVLTPCNQELRISGKVSVMKARPTARIFTKSQKPDQTYSSWKAVGGFWGSTRLNVRMNGKGKGKFRWSNRLIPRVLPGMDLKYKLQVRFPDAGVFQPVKAKKPITVVIDGDARGRCSRTR